MIADFDELDSLARDRSYAFRERGVALGRFLPAAQNHCIARFEGEGRSVYKHVRAAFEDYREAIDFINDNGSHHSDAIVTQDEARAAEFLRDVDSACVYHNASTRFTDGAEFGMGAEIGISTDKLHARGPMGLEELTTYKYTVTGDGATRG